MLPISLNGILKRIFKDFLKYDKKSNLCHVGHSWMKIAVYLFIYYNKHDHREYSDYSLW